MNELPIFISYRQDDAIELAHWLHNSLHGRTIFASEGTLEIPKTLSVYFDEATPPVDDWPELLERELKRARVLLVICSPGAAVEFAIDIFYLEIRWWLRHRDNVPPILITPSGQRWIPRPIKERWPRAQTINLSLRSQTTYEPFKDQSVLDTGIKRILHGIVSRLRGVYAEDGSVTLPTESQCMSGSNIPGLYTWEKDKHFRYISCNENYARAAGFDSPRAVIGKTDDDMPWRSLADFFRQGDQRVMNAESPAREHVHENEIMVDRVADILVTENQLLTKNGACVGVTGYFLDITGKQLVPVEMQSNPEAEFHLGAEFQNQSFSGVEANVFKGLLRKFPPERIASTLNISKVEVESNIASVMHKLQCRTLGDVIATVIKAGLPMSLFGPE